MAAGLHSSDALTEADKCLSKIKPQANTHRHILVGPTVSGKTYYLINKWFKGAYANQYDIIVWYSGTSTDQRDIESIPVRRGGKVIFKKMPTIEEIGEFYEEVDQINESLKAQRKKPIDVAIVFDDLIGDKSIFNNRKSTQLDKMFYAGRHSNISTYVIAQGWTSFLSKAIREINASAVIVFPVNMETLDEICKVHTPPGRTRKEFKQEIAEHLVVQGEDDYPYAVINITTRLPAHKLLKGGRIEDGDGAEGS